MLEILLLPLTLFAFAIVFLIGAFALDYFLYLRNFSQVQEYEEQDEYGEEQDEYEFYTLVNTYNKKETVLTVENGLLVYAGTETSEKRFYTDIPVFTYEENGLFIFEFLGQKASTVLNGNGKYYIVSN